MRLLRTARLPSARTWTVWAGIAVSAVFAYFAVRGARPGQVWSALRNSDYVWLVPALATLALWFLIRAVRWRSLFAPERRPPFRSFLAALYIGYFFNNVLPVRAGEAFRVVALSYRDRTSLAETTGTVIVERIFDLLSLLVLLFAILPWLPDLTWLRAAGVLAGALIVGIVGFALVLARYRERPLAFLFRQLARLPLLSHDRLRDAPVNLLRGFLGLRDARTGVTAFFWTTLSWVVMGFGSWFVMLAFGLGLSPVAGELVVIGIGLALVLPSSPAAVGVFEGATVIVLSACGVSGSDALSYALVLHAVNVIPFLVLALPLLRYYGAAFSARRARDTDPIGARA